MSDTTGGSVTTAGNKSPVARAWAIVVGLGVLHGFGMGTIMSGAGNFVVPITTELGFLPSELVLWTTFFGVFAAVAQLTYVGKLWLKFDARILLTVMFLITMVAYALMGAYSQPWQWWISGAVVGLAGGTYFTVSKQMICPNWFANKSGTAIGVAQFIGLAIAAAFSPIQAMIIANIGWRLAYPLLAVICCVFVLPFCLFVIKFSPEQLNMKPVGWKPSEGETETGTADAPGVPAKKAFFTVIFVVLFLCAGLNALGGGFKTLYGTAANFWGYDAMFAATMISLASLGAAIMNPIMGFVIDKLGPYKGGYVCCGFMIISCCCFIFFNSMPMAILFAVFILEAQSPLLATAIPLATRKAFGPRDYPKIFARVAVGMSFIGAFSSPIVAVIFETTGSFDGSFLMLAVIAVLIILGLTYVMIARKRLVWEYPDGTEADPALKDAA